MTSQVNRSGRSSKAALADEVATLVYGLTRAWDARMDVAVAGLREREGVTLTSRQALAIWSLNDPMSMGELAAALGCDQSNVTGIVDRLERAGLVERRVDGSDRRVKRLVLSTQGARLRQQLDGLLGAGPALARLRAADLRLLRDLLLRTYEVSSPPARRPPA